MKHSADKIEYGDFQTPMQLATQCCEALHGQLPDIDTVIEPTCGCGTFVTAAADAFADSLVIGFEINDGYRRKARQQLGRHFGAQPKRTKIKKQDFFLADWQGIRDHIDGSVLFLGNPPWVTNSQLGVLNSSNLPAKSNASGVRGIEAMTGKSNFDISESILMSLIDCMRCDQDHLAMLIKTSTARKVVAASWKRGLRFSHASIRQIDANHHFDVNVDACLLTLSPTAKRSGRDLVCKLASDIRQTPKQTAFGWYAKTLVACPRRARRTAFLISEKNTPWRSGIKHDAAKVLELTLTQRGLQQKNGTPVQIEHEATYPLAKGADVANNRAQCLERRLLVTQQSLSDTTEQFGHSFPNAFRYLKQHSAAFAARKSSIYRGRDPFAIFGVGGYTFQPWKIAICGLYKRLQFTVLGPINGQPVVTDDTCYSLSFNSQAQADFVHQLLTSQLATDFFEARIFWDAKRPITADVLRRLDLELLAEALGKHKKFRKLFATSVVCT